MAPIDVERTRRDIPAKKALSIAVQYNALHKEHPKENPPLQLNGTHLDPPMLKKLLVDKYFYNKNDITILMDDGKHICPTRENMINAMHELVEDARPGDHFVFHFSGHGSQIKNLDGTEEDGMDEVIWPADIQYDPSKAEDEKATNYIIDDDLKKILVDSLPPDTHLMVLLDCCHSGTALDLPYNHSDNSLDDFWASPVDPKANSMPFRDSTDTLIVEETNLKSISPRGIMRESIATSSLSRSSTMPLSNGPGLRRNVKGISRSMRMPNMARGVIISRNENGDLLRIRSETVRSGKRSSHLNESRPLANAMSWSACLDSQLGIDCEKGGILTLTFNELLRENHVRTNREMLSALSQGLFNMAKTAKHYFRDEGFGELPQPKPCLGSLRPLEDVLDKMFTF